MPMYEYGCRTCGHRFERLLKAEQRHAPQVCAACGENGALLVFSVTGLVGAAVKDRAAGPCAAPGSDAGWCCGGACQA